MQHRATTAIYTMSLHDALPILPDPRNTVIFIGFQAPGTRGATIKSGAPEVKIYGEFVPIRAQIAAFEQFSDHADPPELLQWLRTDRKSTRLNSSHVAISYAVFC